MKRHWKITSFLAVATLLAVFFACLLPGRTAEAANPTTMSFQGKVVNANGTNVTDNTYSFVFKLYTVSSGGSAIWTETQSSVTVSGGVFQVNLGSVCPFFTANACNGSTPIDFNANPNLYLGITFNSDPAGEMTPRVQLQSVPYAFQADNANKLGGIAASSYVQLSPGSQQTGFINVNGSGTFGGNLVATGTVNGATLSGGTISGGTLTSGAVNSLNVSGTAISGNGTGLAISAGGTAQILQLNGATTGKIQIGNTSSGDVEIAGQGSGNILFGGGSGGSGCTITNSNGNFICDGAITSTGLLTGSLGATISGAAISLNDSSNFATSINGGTSTGTINIGTGTGAQAIHLGDGGTGAKTVTLGSTASSSTTTIQGGSGAGAITLTATGSATTGIIAKTTTNSTAAFQIQNASSASLLTVDTTNAGSITLLGNNAAELKVLSGTTWNTTSTLTQSREFTASVTANGYIYRIAGTNSTGAAISADVEYARLNADGSVGTWAATTSLPVNRDYHNAVYANGYIYVVGGSSASGGGTPTNTVYYTKVNADGTLGSSWILNSNNITTARALSGIGTSNGYLYYVGGGGGPTIVDFAKLNADGSTGIWATTSVLPASKTYPAVTIANGFIYALGGDNAGVSNTVYYAALNSTTGAVGAWQTNGGVTMNVSRAYGNATVANGYIYYIGGYDGTNSVATIQYAALNADGTTGSWSSSATTLPAARDSFGIASANGYFYVVGGAINNVSTNTVYYASTARVTVGGSLDLVGLSGENLNAGGSGGTLTAGNTNIIGDLAVQGQANFNQSLSIGASLSIGGANTGQTVLSVIDGSTLNSVFYVRNLGDNFGATATAGAFINRNSYFGEEFNSFHINNGTADWNLGRGDSGNPNTAAGTAGGGELALDVTLTGTGSAAVSSLADTPGGVEQLNAVSTAIGTSVVDEYLGASAIGNAQLNWTTGNLPVYTAKVKMATAGSNTIRYFVGLSDMQATATGAPTNGVYFTNCSVAAGTTCDTTLRGVTQNAAGTATFVTCGTIDATKFMYLRIEVRATNDVHFFADMNVSNGINEVECGSGSSTTIPASGTGLTYMTKVDNTTGGAATATLQTDFVRIWQDDPANTSPESDASASEVISPQLTSDGALVIDAGNASDVALDAAASDGVVNIGQNNANVVNISHPGGTTDVKGALVADGPADFNGDVSLHFSSPTASFKIDNNGSTQPVDSAIKIGNSAGTGYNKLISSDSFSVAGNGDVETTGAIISKGGSFQLLDPAGQQLISFDQTGSASFKGNLNLASASLSGGLTVAGDANFAGLSTFQKLATFLAKTVFQQDVQFDGHITVSKDTAGYASLKTGESTVHVSFTNPYTAAPVVSAGIVNGQFGLVSVNNVTVQGFDISLKDPASAPTTLSWTAIGATDPQTAVNTSP